MIFQARLMSEESIAAQQVCICTIFRKQSNLQKHENILRAPRLHAFSISGHSSGRLVPWHIWSCWVQGDPSWVLGSDRFSPLARLLGPQRELDDSQPGNSQSFSTCLPNQAEWMCAPICAAPEDTNMSWNSCQMGIQVDQSSGFHEPTISRLE